MADLLAHAGDIGKYLKELEKRHEVLASSVDEYQEAYRAWQKRQSD